MSLQFLGASARPALAPLAIGLAGLGKIKDLLTHSQRPTRIRSRWPRLAGRTAQGQATLPNHVKSTH
jgi:hypothetical protein